MTFTIKIVKEDEKKSTTLWNVEEFYTDSEGLTAYCGDLEITAKFEKNKKITIEVE